MLEVVGDMWDYVDEGYVPCILTNGTIKDNRENIMGGGCALEAAKRWPELPRALGEQIIHHGVSVYPIHVGKRGKGEIVLIFPTKVQVKLPSNINIIVKSCLQAREFSEWHPEKKFILPRPGVGLGGLNWEDVKPVIETILLTDRFTVITNV